MTGRFPSPPDVRIIQPDAQDDHMDTPQIMAGIVKAAEMCYSELSQPLSPVIKGPRSATRP
jgi:hypothetical protein